MSSRFETPDRYTRNGTFMDTFAMGDAIEALENQVKALAHVASDAKEASQEQWTRLKAIEDQVRLFNLRLDGHYERHVGLDDRIDPLEDRVKAIAADLSRLEQRTALPPKAEPLADGCYVVRWSAEGSLWVARLTAGRWQTNTGPGQWSNPVESGTRPAPHWIGPRVDLPK